jgi:hypothetical protein
VPAVPAAPAAVAVAVAVAVPDRLHRAAGRLVRRVHLLQSLDTGGFR